MLQELYLRNFRNYESKRITFDKGVNTIAGPNGMGKTNLLEALYILSTGRSFRTNHLKDLINYDKSGFIVEATFSQDETSQTLSFSFDGEQKRILHNETLVQSHSELLGILPSVLYAPNDISLITGSPSDRRRYLNIHISQIDKLYLMHLMRYNRAMKQRNSMLKIGSLNGIEVWEDEMNHSATYLMKKRNEATEELCSKITTLTNELSGESFSIKYQPSLSGDVSFEKSRSRDLHIGGTSVGPHRDDLSILLDSKEAKLFSSEGQKRTCITAMRLSELGEHKTLLSIDDFGMHLDDRRKELLREKLTHIPQVILTIPER